MALTGRLSLVPGPVKLGYQQPPPSIMAYMRMPPCVGHCQFAPWATEAQAGHSVPLASLPTWPHPQIFSLASVRKDCCRLASPVSPPRFGADNYVHPILPLTTQ